MAKRKKSYGFKESMKNMVSKSQILEHNALHIAIIK